jgi:predicted RNA-binding Zn ribbon-like protein
MPVSAAATPAPNRLDLVIDFVNTRDVEENTEGLASPGDLEQWLAAHGLLRPGAAARAQDLAAALSLREALRAAMLANNGGEPDPAAWSRIEQAGREGQLGVHFGAGGVVQLQPASEGVRGALAALLTPVVAAIGDGTWTRTKACRADDCAWAFYDRSRNRSGVWCDMAVCGNRTKVRAYRQRSR